MFQGSTSLKYYKRLKIYKNSTNTVSFNPETLEGRSYRWTFCSKIFGKVVFNEYRWSPTTSGHQSAVHGALRESNIDYITVDAGRTEPRYINLDTMRRLYRDIVDLEFELEISKRKDTRVYSWKKYDLEDKIKNFNKLESLDKSLRLTDSDKQKIRDEVDEKLFESLMDKENLKSFKKLNVKLNQENVEEIEL